jgi:ABC-type transporter Mla MlaB component
LALEAQVSIQHVAQLHQRLVSALQNHHSIDIDASAVTSIDTASLQLLVILKQTALQEQKSVAIDFPSEAFIAAANLLGVSELLDVDHPASGLF